jgi:glutaredoxin
MHGKLPALFIALISGVMLWQHKIEAKRDDPRRDTGSNGIVLLSAEWCGYCKALRAALVAHEVPFRELDVETSSEGWRAYSSLRAHGIPVTVIGQDVVYGYDPTHIDGLLKPLGFAIQ